MFPAYHEPPAPHKLAEPNTEPATPSAEQAHPDADPWGTTGSDLHAPF